MLFSFGLSIMAQILKFKKMSKLSLDALKKRAEGIASEELLKAISGGLENACHDGGLKPTTGTVEQPTRPRAPQCDNV